MYPFIGLFNSLKHLTNLPEQVGTVTTLFDKFEALYVYIEGSLELGHQLLQPKSPKKLIAQLLKNVCPSMSRRFRKSLTDTVVSLLREDEKNKFSVMLAPIMTQEAPLVRCSFYVCCGLFRAWYSKNFASKFRNAKYDCAGGQELKWNQLMRRVQGASLVFLDEILTITVDYVLQRYDAIYFTSLFYFH